MKVTTDIALFLKRNGTKLTLSFDEKTNTFLAWTPGDECASRYLDDALDNLQEAFRRRANAMTPVREAKAEPTTTYTPPACPQNIKFNISYAPPPKINGAVPSCPTCGMLPVSVYPSGTTSCKNGHAWVIPLIPGLVIVHDDGSKAMWNGVHWQ